MLIRRTIACLALLAAALHAAAGPAAAQAAATGQDKGLLGLIPKDAVVFIERRGHTAIREVFLASNLGKMTRDPVIKQFVHDTRIRIGQMICKEMFDLASRAEIVKHQKILHKLLKPFWYQPCAMFVVVGPKGNREPQLGFLCLTGQYKQECQDALAALMKIGVPPEGTAGHRQAFTYEKSAVVWQGVAKTSGDDDFSMPKERDKKLETLKGKSLFMVSWTGRTLCVTTGLKAADGLSSMLSLTQRGKSVLTGESLGVVMAKTAVKDWAFRWFFDVEGLLAALKDEMDESEPKAVLAALGLDKVRGMGGSDGYADNVFVRRTYVHAPKATGGILRIFRKGGSYKKAHAMAPDSSSIFLAAQLDTKALTRMIRGVATAAAGGREVRREVVVVMKPGGKVEERRVPPKKPEKKAEPKLDKGTENVLKQIDLLAEASDGNVCGFVTELQAVMGMAMGGGPPFGVVLGLKDPDKATQAIDALVKIAQADEKDEDAPAEEEKPKRPASYRKVQIRRAGEMLSFAIMKDRAILAMNDSALKATIDAALDGTGGFPANSPAPKLVKMAGEGPALFVMDLAALAKAFWPLLVDMAGKAEQRGEDFPFGSVPSVGKMVRLLGPEVLILQPDADGLMMRSRGKIPFATTALAGNPFVGFFFMFAMF